MKTFFATVVVFFAYNFCVAQTGDTTSGNRTTAPRKEKPARKDTIRGGRSSMPNDTVNRQRTKKGATSKGRSGRPASGN